MTISANPQTKVYGAALPTFTASYSGFVNGDNSNSLTVKPQFATTATVASHVASGPYTVSASGAVDPNYTINYVSGSLTVTPETLMVTPVNVTKVFGAAIPTLTAIYSGFVNGDTAANLSPPVALSTTATAASGVGTYPIIASGGGSTDYHLTYGQGSLTVPADPAYSAFVTTLYQDILGRLPDTAGFNLFVTALDQGASKLAVTGAIYNSTEAAGDRTSAGVQAQVLGPQEIDLVISLYEDVLGRAPEAGGMAIWLGRFQAGETAPQVAAGIEASPEAVADRSAPPVPGPGVQVDLVTALYEDLLGRAPEASGVSFWLARMAGGEDAAGISADISNSPEAVQHRNG